MTRPPRYAAHAGFIAPARGTLGLRPVILGFIIIESLYELGQRLFAYLLHAFDPGFAEAVRIGDTASGLLVNLATFAWLGLCISLVLRFVHGTQLIGLFGPRPGFARQFGLSFLYVALLFVAVETLFGSLELLPAATARPIETWLLLLGPALAALMIQTGAEELFYRGYLQQRVAVLMPHPLAWLILPNIPFALAHWSSYAPGLENAAYLIWAFCFGLVASDLTARAGSLAPAMGMHLANNAYAFLFFAETGGGDSGLALFLFDPGSLATAPADGLLQSGLPGELLLLFLTWIVARFAITR